MPSASVEKGSFTHVHMLTINKLCSVDFKTCVKTKEDESVSYLSKDAQIQGP